MAVVDTPVTVQGIRSAFFEKLRATPNHYERLATRLPSTSGKETYAFLGATPQMRIWAGGRVAKGLNSESYDVVNEKYEATLEVDRNEWEDQQFPSISVRVNELAVAAATHKDYLIAQLLINGATSGFHSYDGVPFFGPTHEFGSSGAQDNDLTGAITDKDDPNTTEFRTAFKLALAALLAFKDDRGMPQNLTSTGLVAVVPPSMFITALEALSATVLASTTNVLAGAGDVICFPWLTDTDTWYLLKTDGVVRPFIFQDRIPVELTALMEDSETGFLRDIFLFGVRARYKMTYGNWAHALRYVFTTA